MAFRPPRTYRQQAEDIARDAVRVTASAESARAVRASARCFALLPVGAPEAVRAAVAEALGGDADVLAAVRRTCLALVAADGVGFWTEEERCRERAGTLASARMEGRAVELVEEALAALGHRHHGGCDATHASRRRTPSACVTVPPRHASRA